MRDKEQLAKELSTVRTDLEKTLSNLESQRAAASGRDRKSQETITDLNKKVEQIEQELAQTREQADSASKRYEEVSEAKNELESRLQAEKEDNQILKQKYEALATKNQSLQSRAAQTDSHSPGHKEQVSAELPTAPCGRADTMRLDGECPKTLQTSKPMQFIL